MNRRDFLKAAAGVVGGATLGGCSRQGARLSGGRQPNFVFFLIDDMGWADLGCYGSTFYETPNIDRLAARGMRFTDAYAACPVCSPTRASILTGKYPARLNLTDWIPGRQHRGARADEKLLGPKFNLQMPLEEVTVAEALNEAGYTCGFVGKWHLGKEDYYPEKQGFDVNVAGNDRGSPPDYFHPYKRGQNWRLDLPGGSEGEYLTDRLTDEAVHFLDMNSEKPFLLYFSHYAVHIPLQAKKDLTQKYVEKAESLPPTDRKFAPEGDRLARQVQDHAVYAAMVQSVDESVGRVLGRLEALGVADRTVVVFMSDNGGLSTAEGSPTSNLPLRAGKGWLYEGGIREPMLIHWPGVTAPGGVCEEPVTSTDFYPTMLEMAGLPLRPSQHKDGKSLVPLLQGRSLDRGAIYWHYPHYSKQGGRPGGAVRLGEYKLIENYEDGSLELYNLHRDPGEQENLAEQMPAIARQMRDLLAGWRQSVDAQMPGSNPDYRPKEDDRKINIPETLKHGGFSHVIG